MTIPATSNVLPADPPPGRPSWGLALCTIATLVPTVWLLWPQPNTTRATPGDVALSCVFLVPQLLAFLASGIRHPAGRSLTVALASIGLALSVAAVPLYFLGVPFVVQAGVATFIAVRRMD